MNIIVGNAWPYANGPLHLGRIAVLMPGDVIARYHRLMGDNVIFLSGTDCHGTPVTMRAKEEGITPLEATKKYHEEFQKCFKGLGFSFDIFSKTHSKYHEDKVKDFILELYNKGYVYEKEVDEIYCENCTDFLSDRYIVGKCPKCNQEIDGDYCESCSEIIENNEVIDKRCKICGTEPIPKRTKHLFFELSKFEKDVKRLLIRQKSWRENAEKIVKRYLEEGLRDKAVTRNFNWGVDVPLDGYEDKKIYVWIEAVMGYLTASMKVLEERDEEWKDYWEGEDSRVYFVHGKDNIPFHTVIFPAILSGLGIKNPNLREISSEYMKLEGKNFSAVKNWAIWADYVIDNYNIDAIRYYLLLNSPENKDTEFTWRDFINVVNRDLVDNLNDYVEKVLNLIKEKYSSEIPKGKISKEVKERILNLYFDLGDCIEEGRFKSGISMVNSFIRNSKKNFQKEDKSLDDRVYEAIQIIVNLSNILEPFIPLTSEKIKNILDVENNIWSYTEKKEGKINNFNSLFERIDKKVANEEIKRMKEEKF